MWSRGYVMSAHTGTLSSGVNITNETVTTTTVCYQVRKERISFVFNSHSKIESIRMFFAFGAQQSIFPAKCTLRVVILKTFIIFVKKMCQKIQIIVSTNN